MTFSKEHKENNFCKNLFNKISIQFLKVGDALEVLDRLVFFSMLNQALKSEVVVRLVLLTAVAGGRLQAGAELGPMLIPKNSSLGFVVHQSINTGPEACVGWDGLPHDAVEDFVSVRGPLFQVESILVLVPQRN